MARSAAAGESRSMSRRFTPEQRARLTAKFRKSGLTQREFARREGITMSALQNWIYRLSKQPDPAARSVEVVPSAPVSTSPVEIRLGEVGVMLPTNVAPERVAAVVSALVARRESA